MRGGGGRYGTGGTQKRRVVGFLWPGKLIGKVIYILAGGNFSARGPSQHNFMFFSCTLSLFSFLGKWTVRAWRRSPKFFWQLPFTGKARRKDNTHIREWSKQFASLIDQVSTNSKGFYPPHQVFIRLGKNREVRDRGDKKRRVVGFLWPGKLIGKVIYILAGGNFSARGPSQHNFMFFSYIP